jgi:hypothetical protein
MKGQKSTEQKLWLILKYCPIFGANNMMKDFVNYAVNVNIDLAIESRLRQLI